MKTIILKRPIVLPAVAGGTEQKWDRLELRDIDAGDIIDAGRDISESASQTELQLRVAAKCADLPFAVIRKIRPVDMVQLEVWWREQWSLAEGDEEENPSQAGGTKPAS